MGFNDIPPIEKVDWYLDLAFKNATKKAKDVKSQKGPKEDTIKKAELAKLNEIRRTLTRHLNITLKAFPSIDGMTEFYQELVRASIDYKALKQSLGALNWALQKVDYFSSLYAARLQKCRDFKALIKIPKEYYGRVSSVMKQVKKNLIFLEDARKTFREFPSIKQGLFTVAIAGFPNVGKTTLLTKLTTSKAQISNYAFTTKKLNTGYATINKQKVQFIDTPGTLNRFDKMNPIEKQAHLAIKYCADLIVFVFDTSDHTYEPETQMKLLKNMVNYRKQNIIFLSKTDLESSTQPDFSSLKSPKSEYFSNVSELRKKISTFLQ